MTYKREAWENALERLFLARERLTSFRAGSRDSSVLLDEAIWLCWTFGEFAINVCIELHGLKPSQNHSQPAQARMLKDEGLLSGDYEHALDQLERFRKKASHITYVKEKSTHYNATNVENCVAQMEELRVEVEALLRLRGKI